MSDHMSAACCSAQKRKLKTPWLRERVSDCTLPVTAKAQAEHLTQLSDLGGAVAASTAWAARFSMADQFPD